jgi:small neutral amino acid transporter SnatA (MarC family)
MLTLDLPMVVATGAAGVGAVVAGRRVPGTVGRRVLGSVTAVGLVAVGVFGVLAPPEHCPSVTEHQLRAAAADTVTWFVRNQNANGTWLYQYRAADDEIVPDYNVVRHAGAIMGLYQAARAGYPDAQDSADRGLDWLLDHRIDRHDWTAIDYQGEISTGAAGLLLAGLSDRRQLTGDHHYDDLMRRIGRFLSDQIEPSGAVAGWYSAAEDAPIAGVYSKYYTGETYWALARLHRTFPDEGWDADADRIGAYLATRRDDVENNWPPIPDHWAAYGLSETVEFPGRRATDHPLTADEEAYARRQSEMFGSQVRWISQRFGPWGVVVRTPRQPRGGGYGVVGEALTGFWRAAEADPGLADVRAPLATRAECLAGLAIAAQSNEHEAAAYPRPDRVAGAWFRNGETRMDDQQHALAALLRTVAIVKASPGAAGATKTGGGEMPSTWLWLVALVAAFNPFRTALSVPRAGRSRRGEAEVALLGGVAGSGLALLVAWAGGPLLDALDVSGPAIRLAAGIVGGAVGLVAVFRRPAPAEPALAGRAAALVPVAVPLVATPALLLLALSAHADHGFPVLIAALALSTAALALVTPTLPPPASALAGSGVSPAVVSPAASGAGSLPPAAGALVTPAASADPPLPEGGATLATRATPAADSTSTEDGSTLVSPAASAADSPPASGAGEALVTPAASGADSPVPASGGAIGPTSDGGAGAVVVLWAARVTAVVLVVASVALAIDGVLSV